jgi:DNA-binding CsgD family transcriptional regulator
MAELPAGGLEAAIEVGQVASGPGRIEERAEALLAPLARLIPFQAAWVCILDPEGKRFVSLATHGYDDHCRSYFDSSSVFEEAELLGLNRAGTPLRMRDMPVPAEETVGWTEYIWPAGFREGLGIGLFTTDGRHIGMLTLNTDTSKYPTRAARDFVGQLGPLIANAVDPMRSIAAAARIVGDAEAGIVLTRGGTTMPLPGLPTHRLLATGSAVLAAAAERIAYGRVHTSFLCWYPSRDSAERHVRITVIAGPTDAPHLVAAVVLVSPAGDLRGLTRRELEIVGLLVDGWPNQRIAAALFIAERTVATHVEHILVKLGAATRALAAVRALRYGLYVPRPLNGVRS